MEEDKLEEVLSGALVELVKATPFGVVCALFLYINNRSNTKNLNMIKNLYNKTIKEMKELYEKVYGGFQAREEKVRVKK